MGSEGRSETEVEFDFGCVGWGQVILAVSGDEQNGDMSSYKYH